MAANAAEHANLTTAIEAGRMFRHKWEANHGAPALRVCECTVKTPAGKDRCWRLVEGPRGAKCAPCAIDMHYDGGH